MVTIRNNFHIWLLNLDGGEVKAIPNTYEVRISFQSDNQLSLFRMGGIVTICQKETFYS